MVSVCSCYERELSTVIVLISEPPPNLLELVLGKLFLTCLGVCNLDIRSMEFRDVHKLGTKYVLTGAVKQTTPISA